MLKNFIANDSFSAFKLILVLEINDAPIVIHKFYLINAKDSINIILPHNVNIDNLI